MQTLCGRPENSFLKGVAESSYGSYCSFRRKAVFSNRMTVLYTRKTRYNSFLSQSTRFNRFLIAITLVWFLFVCLIKLSEGAGGITVAMIESSMKRQKCVPNVAVNEKNVS